MPARWRVSLPALALAGVAFLAYSQNATAAAPNVAPDRHAVSREHPRLLGSRERLQGLARERPEAYRRVVSVAREQKGLPKDGPE